MPPNAEIKISSVEGNHQWLDGGAMFGNAPRAVWEKWLSPDKFGRVELQCRGLLIEIQGKKILCETGIGVFFEPKLQERYGVKESEHILLKSLAALGLSDNDIDYVILSHLHFDHAGGLLKPFAEQIPGSLPQLLFPRAKFVVGRIAFERSKKPHPRDRASFIPGLDLALEQSGRLLIVDGPTHPGIFPERISFRYSDGHTPGQMLTTVKGNKDTIVFAGDLVPGTAWVHVPITMGYDRYAELVIDEKNALYDSALKDNWMLFYTHDPKVAASYLERDAKNKVTACRNAATLLRREL